MIYLLKWSAGRLIFDVLTRALVVGALVSALMNSALAQDSIDGILPKGTSYESRILVVTGPSQGTAVACGILGETYDVMVINAKEPPIMTILVVPLGTDISVGRRFSVRNESSCSTTHVLLDILVADNST